MRYIITSVLFFFVLNVCGQRVNSLDYKVVNSDLEFSRYEKDTLANAVVLYELGKSHIEDERFNLVFEFKQKLKILNRNGFDKANIEIYLYNNKNNKETIRDIVATTYNVENGEIISVKLDKNQVFKERYNENYTLVKFSMPNVKPGSVITYSYKLTSPFVYKYKPWRFQSDIPKLYSEYQTSIPANYEYSIKLVGSLKLDKNEQVIKKYCVHGAYGASADCTETTYVMKNIPAFIDENFMTTRDNYLSRVDYELKVVSRFDGTTDDITKTWKDADKELMQDQSFGKQMKKRGVVKGFLSNDIITENDMLKKSKSIFEFVQNEYVWNKKYNIFKNVSIKNLIKTRHGNVSEINFLLYNLLIDQGVDVTPVLLSTRNNGLPTKLYPVISDFNYIIIQANINGEKYFLDATNKYLSFGQLPFRCLNQYGRLMNFKKGSEWVLIEPKHNSVKKYDVELKVTDSLTVNGIVKYKTTGYHALPNKSSFSKNSIKHFSFYKNKYPEIEFSNYNSDDVGGEECVFEEFFEVGFVPQSIGNNIYVNPFLFKLFEGNPFKLQERTYPIDFGYKDVFLYTIKIEISEGIQVVDVPKEKLYYLPNNKGQVVFKSLVEGNFIRMYFKFDFKEAIYDSTYYVYLKDYMTTVIDVQNNTLIVLKKK